ncbi:MAG: outer membrane beta-barrel protein [Saprospiraceae bacterium]
MKKQITLIILLFTSIFTFAQTDEGNKLVGGTVSFGTQFVQNNDNLLFLNFNPNYGKFVTDHVAAGAGINLNFQKQSNNNVTSLSILPFGRYYVGDSDVIQFYAEVKGGFIYQRVSNIGGTANNNGFQVNAGPGVAFFLNENVSLDLLVNYEYLRFDEFAINKRLTFNFGFQIYLDGE